MIPVQEAIRTASDYLKGLFPEAREVRLEEVELDDNGAWDITLSFLTAGGNPAVIAPIGKEPSFDWNRRMAIGIDPRRTFKVVELDPEGNVKAVRIRQIVVG